MKSSTNRQCLKTLASVIAFSAFSLNLWAQQANVSLEVNDVQVEQALLKLRKESGYKFLFNHEEVKHAGRKTLNIKNSSLTKVLDALLEGTNLTYRIENNVVVIMPVQKADDKKNVRIQGTVVDKNDNPLPGASVVIPGTRKGTVTDIDGKFALETTDDVTRLQVSMIGMETQTVRIGKQRVLHVILDESENMLGDVVVTGYQTISKERSAGSFSIVQGDDIADKAGLTGSIVESMEGLTTGLNVSYGEGQEQLTIRGVTSINSTRTPLYVVDGIPIEADAFETMVNSNDIKSITFLKDATAASIWGAQAANGVIVVTTKQGENTGKKVRISYNGSYTYRGIPDSDYKDYMNTARFMQAAQETFDPDYYTWDVVTTTANGISGVVPVVYPHEQILYGRLNGMSDAEANGAWQRLAAQNNRQQIEGLFYTPEFLTNHSLSFSGGSDVWRFYGSFGYEHETTYTKGKDNTYKLNLRQDFTPVNWLKIDLGINLALADTHRDMLPSETDLESVLPYQMFQDSEGNALSHADLLFYEPNRLTYEQQSGKSLDYVPLSDNADGFHKANGYDARLNLGIHIDLFKGLSYDGRFQCQRGTDKEEVFYDQDSYRVREELVSYATYDDEKGTPVFYLPVSGGYYTQSHTNTTNWTVRNQLMYDRVFERIESQFTALAGFEIRSDKVNVANTYLRGYNPQTMTYTQYDELFLTGTGVSNPIIPSITNPATLSARTNSFSEVEKRFVSVYANAAYTYKQKYSLNASIRVDQSNLFGSDPSVQFKPIWSVGATWSAGQEDFIRSAADWIDRLDLRFSYGLSGNSPDPGLGGPYDILYPKNDAIFSDLGQGYVVITPANDKLTWEKTRTVNAGLDFALLGNRLSGSIDVYFKNTTNLLGNVALHPSSGWSTALANFGSMKNQGFELTLNSHNIKACDFNWRTALTLSYNKNKVTELYVDDANSPSALINKEFVAGYAAGALFAYRWAGLDELGDPQVYDESGNKVKLSKDLTDVSALRYMGSIQPVWYGGLTNTFTYKDFGLSFMFIYNLGHKMRNDVNSFWHGRLTSNIHKDFADRWREPGDEARTDIPSYMSNSNQSTTRRETNFYRYADINVLDASYVKLRDLTFSYTLPADFCRKLSCDNIRLRLQASNLFCIAANDEGIDPEAHNLRYGYRGDHYGPLFSVGLNINL